MAVWDFQKVLISRDFPGIYEKSDGGVKTSPTNRKKNLENRWRKDGSDHVTVVKNVKGSVWGAAKSRWFLGGEAPRHLAAEGLAGGSPALFAAVSRVYAALQTAERCRKNLHQKPLYDSKGGFYGVQHAQPG